MGLKVGQALKRVIFSQNCASLLKIRQREVYDFLADFSFFSGNQDFRGYGGIAKTQMIPKEYQWFWRVDRPENANTTKFTKFMKNVSEIK